jgi:L-rhamnose mutarotase
MKNAKRYGSVIGVKKKNLEEYKKLHAAVWPDILKIIKNFNIRNYSIYLGELEKNKFYLFSYFEYVGNDLDADMKKMAADKTTQKWFDVCMPCQKPIESRAKGEWWMSMEEVFHTD